MKDIDLLHTTNYVRNAEYRARDAKGSALFCEGLSRAKKAGAIAEPAAARPGAQKPNRNINQNITS